ncbi:response regulator [Thermobifida fusca]|nr:winged helix family transcriptional regulator [Thermobifida sp.]PPS91856.1 response regulator [Thermobifida fusca]
MPPGEAGPPPGAPGLLRAESRGARTQPPLAAEVTKIKPTKQVDLIELLAHHGAMLTSDIHRPVRDADAALPHRDEERLLGVIPLTDRRKVMVVVGHVVEAANGTDSTATGPLNDDALVIDRDSWQVWAYGKPVSLSYQEFRLLAHLASAPGRVFTRQELLDQVWAPEAHTTARSVDVHVHRIRRKLGALGERLVTVRRVGYVYRPR